MQTSWHKKTCPVPPIPRNPKKPCNVSGGGLHLVGPTSIIQAVLTVTLLSLLHWLFPNAITSTSSAANSQSLQRATLNRPKHGSLLGDRLHTRKRSTTLATPVTARQTMSFVQPVRASQT
eukprot:365749-Chlamydomonas_euryale.AAC.2